MGNKAVKGGLIGGVLLGPVGVVAGAAIGAEEEKKKRRREAARREEEARRQQAERERAERERREAEERQRRAEEEARRQEQLRREAAARAERERKEADARRQRELEAQRRAAERTRKEQEIAGKERELREVQTRLAEKNALLRQEENKLQSLNARVNQEEKEISHFQSERNNPQCRVVVTMGMTGSGKSTICNRLSGDTSEEGDKGSFKVSHDFESETKEIAKRMVIHSRSGLHLAVVDTPGANDSQNRDRTFTNQLVAFLRGCNGVNCFILFFDLTRTRFEDSYKKYLAECKHRFGDAFWNHVVVVATKADTVRANKLEEKVQRLVEHIKQTLSLPSHMQLDCLPIGHNNYAAAIDALVGKVKTTRFDCQAIKSPIDDLKRERDAQTRVVHNARSQRDAVTATQNNLQATINSLRRALQ